MPICLGTKSLHPDRDQHCDRDHRHHSRPPLGKFKNVASVYDRTQPGRPRFESVSTSRRNLARLLAEYAPARVVIASKMGTSLFVFRRFL
jgi:hypothetical protein